MKQNFPAYSRPTEVCFLDDDYTYLEMLSFTLPSSLAANFFMRSGNFIDHMKIKSTESMGDLWHHQQMINKWRAGEEALAPQIISYWRQSAWRFHLVDVIVVDYYMPTMNGVDVIESIENWHGASILLTGRAEEKTAVNAFNRGLIHKFIDKQTLNTKEAILESINGLTDYGQRRLSDLWMNTLSPEQQKIMQDKEVISNLDRMKAENAWIEHFVIPSPFGVLGLNPLGVVEWLKIEQRSNLNDLSEIAQESKLPISVINKIFYGKLLTDLELRLDLKSTKEPQISDALPLDAAGNVLGSIFSVFFTDVELWNSSYNGYMSRRPGRSILR